MEEQEKNRIKEVLKEVAIIQAGGTAQFSRADPANNRSNVNTGNAPNHDEQFQDTGEHVSETIFENNQNMQNRNQNTAERNRLNLNAVHQQNAAGLLGAHNMLDPPNVTERRQEQYNFKRNPHFYSRKETNRFNEELRQKVERNKDFRNKRSTASSSGQTASPQQLNISTPPLSPRGTPDKLQKNYDKRLVETMAKRKPTVPKPKSTPPQTNEVLEQKRASATQIAKKRERKKEPNTKRSRQKTPYGARS